VLRAVLADAVLDGLIADNPAARAKRPGVARREARHLSAGDVVKILDAVAERYRNVLVLIATTGLRRGEALGLCWSHVDLPAGVLKVVATANVVDGQLEISEPKSGRSRRTVPLSPPAVALLKTQRVTQAAGYAPASCGLTRDWCLPTRLAHRSIHGRSCGQSSGQPPAPASRT
jgi:integrase